MDREWYVVDNISELDSPALLIYSNRVEANIETLVGSIGNINRLRPHVKTHKSLEVSKLMLKAGIRKFKCATIAEAEMLALAGAPDVLLAYQPVGPKLQRFVALVKKYGQTKFSCLVDAVESASVIDRAAQQQHLRIPVFID